MKKPMTNLLPVNPSHIEAWILRVVKDGPRKRSEVFERVVKVAQAEGFSILGSDTLKVALRRLAQKGQVVRVQQGWWALAGTRWNGERWSTEPARK